MLLLALWTLTGLAWVLTFMGMFSIGVFVLPFAVGLLVLSIVLTVRRPSTWPSVAGLGVALAVGVGWLGWTLSTAGPSEMFCSGGTGAPTVCTSGGRVIDPEAVDWAVATPWLVSAVMLALVSVAAYSFAAARGHSTPAMPGR